ncbi:AMPK-b [Acrasis kona]|uniref:AMPK-b n=1 Tax=Acrasis kona TaxID=1008807 RepID=A0AAW2YRY1_9EUKA
MFSWSYGGRKVYIVGTFNQWKEKIPMNFNSDDNSFVVILNVAPGRHLYRFIVDNEYKTDPNSPTCADNQGYLHNMVQINESEIQPNQQGLYDIEESDFEDEDSDDEHIVSESNSRSINIKNKARNSPREQSPKQSPSFKVPKTSHPERKMSNPPPNLSIKVQQEDPKNNISQQGSNQVGLSSTTSSPSASPVTQYYEHKQNFIQQQMMMHQQQYQQQQQQQQQLEKQKEVAQQQQQQQQLQQQVLAEPARVATPTKPIVPPIQDFANTQQQASMLVSPLTSTPTTPTTHQPVIHANTHNNNNNGSDHKMNEDSSPRSTEVYGYLEQHFAENKKSPPTLPPHLRYTPLNASKMYPHDPCLLPVPLHVTVNHTYFSERETMNVIGITQRYKDKFSTAVLYKPKKSKQ